jgi:hypothetical protein
MIGLTLIMATLTTVFGITEAYAGARILPPSADPIVGAMVILSLSAQFVGGSFLFALLSPQNTIQREIVAAMVTDSEEVAKQVKMELSKSREDRVKRLADQLSINGDRYIMSALSENTRAIPMAKDDTPKPARLIPSTQPSRNGSHAHEGGEKDGSTANFR